MALIVETGAGVTDAEAYASASDLTAFAAKYGITLPAGDPAKEVLLRKGADFLESLESRFKGSRVDSLQALAWPRSDVFLFGATEALATGTLPDALVKAQLQLACDAITVDLQPTGTGQEVVRKKVDVLEVEFAKRGSGSIIPELNKAMGILAPLFNDGSFALTSTRV